MSEKSPGDGNDNLGFDFNVRGGLVARLQTTVQAQPTSANFRAEEWAEALRSEGLPDDFRRLLSSGLWLGSRMAALRARCPAIFAGFERDDATLCALGYANAAYLKNRRHFAQARKDEAKRLGVGTTLLGHTVLKVSGTKQVISEDHLATTIIDCLSHAIFYARTADGKLKPDEIRSREAARAFRFSNIEFVYRACWLQVLWEGYKIEGDGEKVYLRPSSNTYGEWWPVWDVRRQNLIAEQLSTMCEGVFGRIREQDVPDVFKGYIPAKRVERAHWRDGRWDFRLCPTRTSDREYRSIVTALIGVTESSLWPYVSEAIPKYVKSGLTLGNVLTVWHVLESCVEEIAKSITRPGRDLIEDIRAYAFSLHRARIIEVVAKCSELSVHIIEDSLDFLCADIENRKFLFNRGVWANPLISTANSETLSFVVPVFTIGNIVRAFENWIEQGDFSRNGELKGSHFETTACDQLRAACATSELPVITKVFGPNLEFRGEEIDCVVQVGRKFLILECKNFLTPGDSLERYNAVKRINKGAHQASRKAQMVGEHLDAFGRHLGVEPEKGATVEGVVVTASSYGVGLNFGSVAVVDLSYLIILVSSLSMLSAVAQKGEKTIKEITHLYAPFGFSLDAFMNLIRKPFVQRKYFDALTWSYEPFPSGDSKTEFLLPFPLIPPSADAEMAKSLLGGTL